MKIGEALAKLKRGDVLHSVDAEYINQVPDTILYWLFSPELGDKQKQNNYEQINSTEWTIGIRC